MRILADVRLLSRGGSSGIEEYTRNILRELLFIDKNNKYSFFYNGLRKEPLDFLTDKGSEVIDWRIPNKIFDFSSRFLNFPAMDKYIKTDLVFSPHFNILKTAHAPRVITFHDLSFLHHPYFFSRRQRFWHWTQDIKRQAREAAKIIAVSEFTKSDLINLLGVLEEKIKVVYSGISINKSPQSKIATLPSVARNDVPYTPYPKPYILYLGTLEPRKNIPALIRAFNILKQSPDFKDWQLVLAGRPGWLYHNISREAAASPFSKDIIFRGAVSQEDKISLYNLAKVFVYPSFFEGFGFPPLEAQASGCPVVAADRTSLPEILGESALLVNPWKVEDLAGAIKEAALNSGLREKLITAGLANAARFTWEKAARETLEFFK